MQTITSTMETGFRLARSASKLSTHDQFKVGAAIMKKRRPVSVGANLVKTHPVFADGDRWYTIHAEMKALLAAEMPIAWCDIFVYRATARDELAMARPCDECLKVLAEAGIRRVYYTTEDGYDMETLEDGKTETGHLQLLSTNG